MSAPTTGATAFLDHLVRQQRAADHYGQLDRVSDERLLQPFIVAASVDTDIPTGCDVDLATQGRIRSYFQAVAAAVEQDSGVETMALIDVNHEGFGWALILAGRLVAVREVLRDVQRFGFPTTERLAAAGAGLVAAGVRAIDRHPEAARDDS